MLSAPGSDSQRSKYSGGERPSVLPRTTLAGASYIAIMLRREIGADLATSRDRRAEIGGLGPAVDAAPRADLPTPESPA